MLAIRAWHQWTHLGFLFESHNETMGLKKGVAWIWFVVDLQIHGAGLCFRHFSLWWLHRDVIVERPQSKSQWLNCSQCFQCVFFFQHLSGVRVSRFGLFALNGWKWSKWFGRVVMIWPTFSCCRLSHSPELRLSKTRLRPRTSSTTRPLPDLRSPCGFRPTSRVSVVTWSPDPVFGL